MQNNAHRGAMVASIILLVFALIANTIGLSIFFSEMAKISNNNNQQSTESETETNAETETGNQSSSSNQAAQALGRGLGMVFAAIFVVLFMFMFTGAAFVIAIIPLIISIVVLTKICKHEQGVGKAPFIVLLICSCLMMAPFSVLLVMAIIHK
ncbi:MAG: hypothetical protein J6023_06645 [Clostridia bacterium]|nr:hypothetical protein [Clostridia bacterium]